MRFLLKFALICVYIYLLVVGAKWNGITVPGWQFINLALIAVLVVVWWRGRQVAGWQWHTTPLDFVFVLWISAFVVSLLANPEVQRRSLIGVWHMMLYIGLWYVVQDALTNGFDVDLLIEPLLISGVLVLIFGIINIVYVLELSGEIPRITSLLGNTNYLAAYLLALIPFAAIKTLTTRNRVLKISMGVYTLVASLFLVMTFSRGGWLAFATEIIVFAALMLHRAKMLSVVALKSWFAAQSRMIQSGLIAFVLFALAGVLAASVWIAASLSMAARSFDLRAYLWESALQQLIEKPLTGQGFFAYGYDLALCACMPPLNPHNHAHNLPLHIGAELGLAGLAALAVSVWVILRVARHNWRQAADTQKPLLIAAVTVIAGFSIHQLLDVPIMLPLIALIGWLALHIVLKPRHPQLMVGWRRMGHPLGIMALWLVVLGSGFWSSSVYLRYWNTLLNALETGDYRASAEALDDVIQADPQGAVYIMQQAYLYGMAAAKGDEQAAQQAIDTYERFLEQEPYHAVSWANKAALHWQLGQREAALTAIDQAIRYAADYELFQRNRLRYIGEVFDETAYDWDDYTYAANFMRNQYFREGFPEPFLPQVNAG